MCSFTNIGIVDTNVRVLQYFMSRKPAPAVCERGNAE